MRIVGPLETLEAAQPLCLHASSLCSSARPARVTVSEREDWNDRGCSIKNEKKTNARCHWGFWLHLEESRVATGELWSLWAIEPCPVRALNKMFEMQFQRLWGCLEAPQRSTYPVQRQHQMAQWCWAKEPGANKHDSPMADTCSRHGRYNKKQKQLRSD